MMGVLVGALVVVCSLLPAAVLCHNDHIDSLPTLVDPIIGGYGDFRYQYMPGLLTPPHGADIQDAHGLEVDLDHNIYVSYANWGDNAKARNSTDQNCLIRWAANGTNGAFTWTKAGQ